MRKLVILIAAAASLAVPFGGVANADDYGFRRHHHERHGEYQRHGDYRRHGDNGAGIALGLGAAIAGAAIASGSRHHARDCWYEKRAFYHHGHRVHRTVKVCR